MLLINVMGKSRILNKGTKRVPLTVIAKKTINGEQRRMLKKKNTIEQKDTTTKTVWMIPNQTRDYYERNQRNNPIEDLNITEKKSTKKNRV